MCVQNCMGPTVSSTFPPLHKIAYIFSLEGNFFHLHIKGLFIFCC